MHTNLWRRYAGSKFRLLVMIAMFGASMLIVGRAFGQTADQTPNVNNPDSIVHLFRQSIGVVSITIILLSVISVTLIIQGFIKCRREVFMPAAATATI